MAAGRLYVCRAGRVRRVIGGTVIRIVGIGIIDGRYVEHGGNRAADGSGLDRCCYDCSTYNIAADYHT